MKTTFSQTVFLLFTVLSVSARNVVDSEFNPHAWIAAHRSEAPAPETQRLLRFAENTPSIPFTEAEVEQLIASGNHAFMDVTDFDLESDDYQGKFLAKRQSTQAFPSKIKPIKRVKDLAAMVSQANLKTYVNELSDIFTRYYTSPGGLEAPTVIFNRVTSIIGNRPDASVRRFTNTFAQNSIIARLEGSSGNQEVTIAGAHLDSIGARVNPATARAPGADDDASSVANLLETFRILVQSGYTPRTPIEVHFYAAEEVGELGSQAIVARYTSQGTPVKAYLNYDMTAYTDPTLNFTMGFVTDRTSASLNLFTKSLASNYVLPKDVYNGKFPLNITDDYCGYPCSDHAPWNTARIPTVYPFEAITSTSNPAYHNAFDLDTAPGFSYPHLAQFSELLTGFFVHLTQ